ncbi:MAG TPA: sulfotransferase domain-containing protein [Actinomycetota bacterium]|jgi:hypothetical protein
MLPTFIIIGAPKAGTTSLSRYLRGHERVFVATMKEPSFFVAEMRWRRGREWYERVFEDAVEESAVGEASVPYTMYPTFAGVPERMASLVPEVRLIYLMRDPIERMRSAYIQHLAEGRESAGIKDALLTNAQYSNSSRYALQLERYLDWFPESQLLLLTSEALRSRRVETVNRVLSFIGVDDTAGLDLAREYNRASDKRASRRLATTLRKVPHRSDQDSFGERLLRRLGSTRLMTRPIRPDEVAIDADLRQRLADVLRPDVERLRRWMEPSFTGWGLLGEQPATSDA